jgi:hypothetical protein
VNVVSTENVSNRTSVSDLIATQVNKNIGPACTQPNVVVPPFLEKNCRWILARQLPRRAGICQAEEIPAHHSDSFGHASKYLPSYWFDSLNALVWLHDIGLQIPRF